VGIISVLETYDISTNIRTVVREFPYLIEAPNWTPDGNYWMYNSGGKLYLLSVANPSLEPKVINTSINVQCNNDHVITVDGKV
jgi:hypothetical protein